MYLYLAQWEWYQDPTGGQFWRAPGGIAQSTLDVRTLAQMAEKGGTPGGWGLFKYKQPQLITGAYALGDDFRRTLTAPQRAELQARLGVQFKSRTPRDMLWDLLTVHSDPAGLTGPKPLIATRAGKIELYLGELLKRKDRTDADRDREIAVFQLDYKRNHQTGLPLDALQRWTGGKMDRIYGRRGNDLLAGLLPAEHVGDGWKPPTTTVSDDFNRGDSSNLGANWTELYGNLKILSNEIAVDASAGDNLARYDTALSGDDHYSQVDVTDNPDSGARQACFSRKDNTSTKTFYRVTLRGTNNQIQLIKFVAGSETQLGSNTAVAVSLPDSMKVESDGSSQVAYWNGESKISETDSAITGNLYCGMHIDSDNGKLDDFEAADLGAPPAGIVPQMMAHEGG